MQYGERTNSHPTEPGWYYVGQTDLEGKDRGDGPIWNWTGAEWLDEDDEVRDRLWDAELQLYVSPAGADFWIRQ